MGMVHRGLGGGWIVLAGLLLAPQAPAAENVKVSVVVIVASETDDKVDPKLECIAREVQRANKNLKGFRLVHMVCKSVPPKVQETYSLIDKQEVGITVDKGADKKDRVQVRIAPPLLGEITYITPCGKFLPIVTRYRPRPDELLIFAVRVQPCEGGR
jgi:hypothetical protein